MHREDSSLPGAEGVMSVVGTTCRIGTTDADVQFWRTCNGSNAYVLKVIILKRCNGLALTILALIKAGEESYQLSVVPFPPNSYSEVCHQL